MNYNNFKNYYLQKVLDFLIFSIKENGKSYIISVKKIRDFHKIKSENKSFINFIWRCLIKLSERDFIKNYDENNHSRKYIISNKFRVYFKKYKEEEMRINIYNSLYS